MKKTKEQQAERVVAFLAKNYPLQTVTVDFTSLVTNWINNAIVVDDNETGEIVGVAFYLMVDDVAINRMADGVYKPWIASHFKEMTYRRGNNLHFWLLAMTQGRALTAGLRTVWQQIAPKSISYFKPDLKTFVYMPREAK